METPARICSFADHNRVTVSSVTASVTMSSSKQMNQSLPLTAGAGNDDLTASDPLFILATSGDVRVHEVAV